VSSSTVPSTLSGVGKSIATEEPLSVKAHVPITPDHPDEVVMQRVQSGDKDALGLLFDRYSRLVLSVGLRILHDMSEAQELVQDVFLYVYTRCRNFDSGKSLFRSWLVQIAYCRAFDRRQHLISRRFYDHCNIEEIVDSVKSNISPENQAELSEFRQSCELAFAELNERQRRTLELFFFQGFSLREISSQMDEPLATTRHHYYRGIEKLKSALKAPYRPRKDGLKTAKSRT
jgi:RNA polymerase sigma-70 factor (ECF subfamily)